MRSYTKVCTDQAFCPIALADGHFEKLSNCKCVEANANFYQFFRTKVIIGMHEKDLSLTWYPKWRGVFSYKEYSILNFKLLWIPDCGKLCNINKQIRVTRSLKEKIASFLLKVAKFVATVIKSFFKPQNIYIKAVLKSQNTYIKGYNKLENIYFKTQILSCYLGEKLKICPQTKISKFVAKFLVIFGRKKITKCFENLS